MNKKLDLDVDLMVSICQKQQLYDVLTEKHPNENNISIYKRTNNTRIPTVDRNLNNAKMSDLHQTSSLLETHIIFIAAVILTHSIYNITTKMTLHDIVLSRSSQQTKNY